MTELLVLEEGYVFKDNIVLFKIYPNCVAALAEGWGIYYGPKEELVEQGFIFDESYHE